MLLFLLLWLELLLAKLIHSARTAKSHIFLWFSPSRSCCCCFWPKQQQQQWIAMIFAMNERWRVVITWWWCRAIAYLFKSVVLLFSHIVGIYIYIYTYMFCVLFCARCVCVCFFNFTAFNLWHSAFMGKHQILKIYL